MGIGVIGTSDASSGKVNNFILNTSNTGKTNFSLEEPFSPGGYRVTAKTTLAADIYFSNSGTNVGYGALNEAIDVSDFFNEVIVLGTDLNDEISFEYLGEFSPPETADDSVGGSPYILSVDTVNVPNDGDPVALTGGNFAPETSAEFVSLSTGTATPATISYSSSSEITVSKPAGVTKADSPYSLNLTNPNVPEPTSTRLNAKLGLAASEPYYINMYLQNDEWQTSGMQSNSRQNSAFDEEGNFYQVILRNAGFSPSARTQYGVAQFNKNGVIQEIFTIEDIEDLYADNVHSQPTDPVYCYYDDHLYVSFRARRYNGSTVYYIHVMHKINVKTKQLVWSKSINNEENNSNLVPRAIAANSTGVYTALYTGNNTTYVWMHRLDLNGLNPRYAYARIQSSGNPTIYSIDLDSSYVYVVARSYSGVVDSDNYHFVMYRFTTGNAMQFDNYHYAVGNGNSNTDYYASNSKNGNRISVQTDGSSTSYQPYFWVGNSYGNFSAGGRMTHNNSGTATAYAMGACVHDSNNRYFMFISTNPSQNYSAGYYKIFLTKVNGSGTVVWHRGISVSNYHILSAGANTIMAVNENQIIIPVNLNGSGGILSYPTDGSLTGTFSFKLADGSAAQLIIDSGSYVSNSYTPSYGSNSGGSYSSGGTSTTNQKNLTSKAAGATSQSAKYTYL